MKNRLQKLWDETVPHPGPAPQPEARDVLRRVDAGLGKPGPRRRRVGRPLRVAVALAAALALFTGVAMATGQLPLPENNVLDSFFSWGGNGDYAASLISTEALSVEDEHLAIIVTSSVADENEVYLTLDVQAKTEAGREFLRSGDLVSGYLFSIEMAGPFGGGSKWITFETFDEETGSCRISASLELGLSRKAVIRLDAPTGELKLNVPVNPIHSVKLRLDAAGPGAGSRECAAGGPVEVETVTLSPLNLAVEYTTPFESVGTPLFYFLWQDGTWSTYGQLHVHGPSGSMGQKGDVFQCRHVWQFGSVQDITKMEALVFHGTAYPLDGGEPYEVDTSGLPSPFTIPVGEELPGGQNLSVPLFALCEGLGIPCEWDGERAVMRYRDVEVTVTAGSDVVPLKGASQDADTLFAPAVYRDGELWADFYPIASTWWSLTMQHAKENEWTGLETEGPRKGAAYWLVTP